MPCNSPNPSLALRLYGERSLRDATITPLGNAGGFSGARLWRVCGGPHAWCLRLWPAGHPNPARLLWIHGLLQRGRAAGLRFLPWPLSTREETTVCQAAGRIWELVSWLPGQADYWRNPNPQRVRAAAAALAALHRCWEAEPANREHGPSPGLVRRAAELRAWLTGGLERLRRPPVTSWPELHALLRSWIERMEQLGPRLRADLESASCRVVPLQPCIRDIWHDHVLWQGDRVSGIVDFGAVDHETVAADLARLFGSLFGPAAELWQIALESYELGRPMDDSERALVRIFERSSALLAPGSWFRWCFLEGRRFDEPGRVVARVEHLLGRLNGHTVDSTPPSRLVGPARNC